MNTSEKELIEVNFYKESKEECSGSESVNNILNKFTDAYIFYDLIIPISIFLIKAAQF